MLRYIRPLFVLCSAALILLTLARINIAWRNDAYLHHASGIWIALADDLNHGVFYRPLVGPLGYGGTRYFPLHFVLHAGLLKLGVEPRLAGHLITLVAMGALLGAIFFLLRGLGADRLNAGCFASLVLVSQSAQIGLTSIRADILPCALNLWGVATCMRRTFGRRHLLGAALLFTLAFSAKLTTVFGVAAVTLSFLLSSRTKQAFQVAGVSAIGFLVVLATMHMASSGRVVDILHASAVAGGGLKNLLFGPLHLALTALEEDPGSVAFIVLGFAALVVLPSHERREIPPLFLVLTAAVIVGIYGSPGTTANHLLDLDVASLLVLASALTRGEKPGFGLSAALLAGILAMAPLAWRLRHQDRFPRRQGFAEALRLIGDSRQPILAENPLLPILAGQRAYLLDPFMFRAIKERDPSFAEPLREKIRNHGFSAVVLELDPDSDYGRSWYRESHFGEDIVRLIQSNYRLAGKSEAAFVYLPRETP